LSLGDLGQSFDSNVTLAHYETNSKAQAVLFVGDLTYADNYPYHDNTRWDTWGRFVERNLAYQPWIWTAGNHEIDFAPDLVRMFQWMFSQFKYTIKVSFKYAYCWLK
jgi:metallophosphoesterase superfamily enzyme